MNQSKIPAISHELEFIANHTDEADDIWDEAIEIDPDLRQLSNTVYERADLDAGKLLKYMSAAISEGADGVFRVDNWHWRLGKWEIWSEIYSGTRGRKKRVGSVGLDVGYGKVGFRLIGWMNPGRGGLDGRKRFALACKKRIEQVHLVSEYQKSYPGWSDCVIWFEKKLTVQTSREELRAEIVEQAKKLAAIAKPLLSHA